MKAFPPTFSTMTLAESHRYFHTQEKACMFVIGSWYTGRAFAVPSVAASRRNSSSGC